MVNHIEWIRSQLQTIEAMLKKEKKQAKDAEDAVKETKQPHPDKMIKAVRAMDKKIQAIENQLLAPAQANSDEKGYLARYGLYLHLIWLNGEVGTGGGDVYGNPGYKPTDASVQVLHMLDRKLQAVKTQYQNLIQKVLPQFDRTLVKENIVPVVARTTAPASAAAVDHQ